MMGLLDFARRIDKACFELHAESQAELLQFVLDFVKRLLSEVAVFEHFGFCLHGKLADRGDIGVVEAVGRADGEFDLVDAHVQELLEPGVFLADLLWRLIEFNLVVVVTDEDIQMMTEDGRGLKQRLVRRDAAIGPDVEDQLVIIGALADTCILDRILDARDGRENRVDGDDADWLVGMLVLVARGKAASDLDFELDVKLLLSVERADVLIGIDDLDSLRRIGFPRRSPRLLWLRRCSHCELRGRAP